MTLKGKTINGDIYRLGNFTQVKFNFICCHQVFEHLEFPERAARSVFQALVPGGTLLYTAPHSSQYHGVPDDYHRYTKTKVYNMLRQAGFCVPKRLMTGGGDSIFDAGRSLGLSTFDFNKQELEIGYQRGYDFIADGAITIHAIGFKPPHSKCNHPSDIFLRKCVSVFARSSHILHASRV